jgi:DNA-binding response OmpR family regulator
LAARNVGVIQAPQSTRVPVAKPAECLCTRPSEGEIILQNRVIAGVHPLNGYERSPSRPGASHVRLLVIDDNARLAEYMGVALRAEGFAVDSVNNGADGGAAIATTSYDAIILDLGLPDVDGLTWLTEVRRQLDRTPVLILTARDGVQDLVLGLNSGADDYLRKPFQIEELVARIRALLRRPGHVLGVQLTQGNVSLDTNSRELTIGGVPTELGRRECGALEVLLRRADRVVPKSAIEEAIYPFGEEVASNAIEVLIHRLRKRMQDAKADVHIHTLRGVGYMLTATPT